MMMLRKLLLLAPLSLFCLVAAHSARGQAPGYNYRHELLDTPVYDSASKSYFEMVDGSHGMVRGTGVDSEGPNWGEAEKFAASRVFKGVHGRLAVVSDLEIHEFLMRTFQPKTFVWFGLRYLCSKQLQDSTGAFLNKSSFMAWAKQWKQTPFPCEAGKYYSIAYTPVTEGFRWIAQNYPKRYYYFFVQYPTGKP